MLEHFFSVLTERGEIVSAELFTRYVVSWRESMLIRVLSTQVGYATGLIGVEIKFEPLVTRAKVIDLKSPLTFRPIVAQFAIILSGGDFLHQKRKRYGID